MDRSSPTTGPMFPEDLEREICEILLDDVREMGGTISLVASRFNAWTKPIKFHTVVVRRHDNWMQRMNECLLPNSAFIRVLVLDLPFNRRVALDPMKWSDVRRFNKDRARCVFSDEELTSIRRLLSAAANVRHLAVTWNIWAYLEEECGTLRLQSLYLIWDRAFLDIETDVEAPELNKLQHPAALEDITMFAPASLDPQYSGWHWPGCYLPDMARCANLAYVTYAASFVIFPSRPERFKGYMSVAVSEREVDITEEEEDFRMQGHANFATLHMRTLSEVLREWLNKVEGRESMLEHPPPRMQDPRGRVEPEVSGT
ncbi:hypothetical protein C8R46DRAFT_1192453 [Mycena filopes]|nr:hypothetical protein C8R46DRAFT_1192453 [Mycena filopes]